jgi:hypothetical protein
MRTVKRQGALMLRMAAALAAVVAPIGLAAVDATPAQAAPGSCWGGPQVTDYAGRQFNTRVCPTWITADVLNHTYQTGVGASAVGPLNANNNWVVCQTWGGYNPMYGGHSNNWWLYTQADRSYGGPTNGWGWLPATAVTYGGDEEAIPGVPLCASYPGYNPIPT